MGHFELWTLAPALLLGCFTPGSNQTLRWGAYIQPLTTITAGQGFEGCMGSGAWNRGVFHPCVFLMARGGVVHLWQPNNPNWMMNQIFFIGNGCFTKHQFKLVVFGFQEKMGKFHREQSAASWWLSPPNGGDCNPGIPPKCPNYWNNCTDYPPVN